MAHLASLQTTARLHGLHAIAFHNNNMPSLITNIFGIFYKCILHLRYSKNIPKLLVIKLGFLLLAHLASLQTTARLHGLHAIAFHNNNMPGLITNIFGIFYKCILHFKAKIHL